MTLFTTLYENELTSQVISPEVKRAIGFREYMSKIGQIYRPSNINLTHIFPALRSIGIEPEGFWTHYIHDNDIWRWKEVVGTKVGYLLPLLDYEIPWELNPLNNPISCERFAVNQEFINYYAY
jgi:hypothetical protein